MTCMFCHAVAPASGVCPDCFLAGHSQVDTGDYHRITPAEAAEFYRWVQAGQAKQARNRLLAQVRAAQQRLAEAEAALADWDSR